MIGGHKQRERRGPYPAAAVLAAGLALAAAGCGNGVEHTSGPTGHGSSAVSGPADPPSAGSRPSGSGTSPGRDKTEHASTNHSDGEDRSPHDRSPHDTVSARPSRAPKGSKHPAARVSPRHSNAAVHPEKPSKPKTRTRTAPPSSDRHPGTAGDARPAAPSSVSSPGGSESAAGKESAAGHTSSQPSRCSVHDLDITVKEPEGGAAAGSRYLLLIFKNTSTQTCRITGHAGVSFVGKGNGTKLGHSAKWSGKAKKIKLKPDKTAPELVKIGQAHNYDSKECVPTTADGFRVYPPHSYSSVLVKHKTDACQRKGPHQLRAYPVGTSG